MFADREGTVDEKKIILIGGGTRSGKSAYALAVARRFGGRKLFIATAQAGDAEMRERIALHQSNRGNDFDTFEEPQSLPETIHPTGTR